MQGGNELRELCVSSYREAQHSGPSALPQEASCLEELAARGAANRRSALPEDERGEHGREWRDVCNKTQRDAAGQRASEAKGWGSWLRRTDANEPGGVAALCARVLKCTRPGRDHRAALLGALSNYERGRREEGTARVLRGGFLDRLQLVRALTNYMGVGVLDVSDCGRLYQAAQARSDGLPLSRCLDFAQRDLPSDTAGERESLVAVEILVALIVELGGAHASAIAAGGARLGQGTFDLGREKGVRDCTPWAPEAMGCLLPQRPRGLKAPPREVRNAVAADVPLNLPRDRLVRLLARRWCPPAGTYGALAKAPAASPCCHVMCPRLFSPVHLLLSAVCLPPGSAVLERHTLLRVLRAFDGACAGRADWEANSLRPCAHPNATAPVGPRRWLAIERRGGLDREQFWGAMCTLTGHQSYRTSQEEWRWDTSSDRGGDGAAAAAAAPFGLLARSDADALFDELLQRAQQRAPSDPSHGAELVAVSDIVDGILRWQSRATGESPPTRSQLAPESGSAAAGHDQLLAEIARAGRAGPAACTVDALQGLLAAWASKSRVLQSWEHGVRVREQESWSPAFGAENLIAARLRRPWIGAPVNSKQHSAKWTGFTLSFLLPQQVVGLELRQCNWRASSDSAPFATGRWRAQACAMETPGDDASWQTLAEGTLPPPTTEWARDGAKAEPLQVHKVAPTAAFMHVRLLVLAIEEPDADQRILAPALAQFRCVPLEEVTNSAV